MDSWQPSYQSAISSLSSKKSFYNLDLLPLQSYPGTIHLTQPLQLSHAIVFSHAVRSSWYALQNQSHLVAIFSTHGDIYISFQTPLKQHHLWEALYELDQVPLLQVLPLQNPQKYLTYLFSFCHVRVIVLDAKESSSECNRHYSASMEFYIQSLHYSHHCFIWLPSPKDCKFHVSRDCLICLWIFQGLY